MTQLNFWNILIFVIFSKDKNVPKGWKKSKMKILQIYGFEDKNIPNVWKYLEDKIIPNDWKTLQRLKYSKLI